MPDELKKGRFDIEVSFKCTNRETGVATVEIEKYIERDVSSAKTLAMQEMLIQALGARLAEQIKKTKDSPTR